MNYFFILFSIYVFSFCKSSGESVPEDFIEPLYLSHKIEKNQLIFSIQPPYGRKFVTQALLYMEDGKNREIYWRVSFPYYAYQETFLRYGDIFKEAYNKKYIEAIIGVKARSLNPGKFYILELMDKDFEAVPLQKYRFKFE